MNTEFAKVPKYFKRAPGEVEERLLPRSQWNVKPKKAGIIDLFGLKAQSIDVWTSDYELEDKDLYTISSISVMIELPERTESLDYFYREFYAYYKPTLDMVTRNSLGQECDQWLADHKSYRILMSLPQKRQFTLEQMKKMALIV